MQYKKAVISYIQTSQGKLLFEQFYLGIIERALLLQSIVSFERFVSLWTTISHSDFPLCMDFYVVISILGPREVATSRFLFYMVILPACR